MKTHFLTVALLLILAGESEGSSEESKYKYYSDEGLAGIARNSQVIVRGKVVEHHKTYYFKGKMVTFEDGMKLASDSDESLVVEVAATIQIEKVLKGPVAGEKITFKWKDPGKTDCPHIPMRPPFMDGIWFTLNESEKVGEKHPVDWVSPGVQEKLVLAIQKWLEQEPAESSSR